MTTEEYFNNGFGEDVQKVQRNHVIDLMTNFAKYYHHNQLILSGVVGQSEQFNFKKGDYLTYIGGSGTKYLEKGEKYRTTWDGTNASGRVAIIGIDKKRLVMSIRFFTI